jgi:hypothetical protein
MSATENDGVRRPAFDGIEVFVDNRLGNLTLAPTLFGQSNKHFTGLLANLGITIPRGNRLPVRAERYGCLGGENQVSAPRTSCHCGRRTRLNDTNNRDRRQLLAQGTQRYGRGCIAGHHQQLDTLLAKLRGRLCCVAFD